MIDGAVNTGGDFVGRDQTIHGDQIARDKITGAGDIHIHHYPPTLAPTSPSADEVPAPGEPPYQGMAYYDVADADRFFGREALTAELVDHLRHNNLLAVIGASGSGKSSLVRAGVLPALQGKQPLSDDKQPPTGSARWAYYLITPTAHPLKMLAASLTPTNESILAQAQLMDALHVEPRTLDLYAHRLVRGDQRLLLVVDQFEELFTLCKDDGEQQAFVDNLLHAATDDGVVTLVLTLRADFYHHCARFPALRTALERQQRYIGAMTRDELRRAIEEPAKVGEWELQAGLVEQLLQDVGDEPGALPLLSHALLATWQRRGGRTLTLAGYRAAGGVQGAIAKTADDVFNRFTDEQKTIARIIFLRLTELGEGVQDTRRRVRPDELKLTQANPDAVQQVLKTLTDARLVTTDEDEVQVAHEALIRAWETLREWLDDDREGNRIQRRLTEAANQWIEFGKEPSLLYRGVLLQQAQEWLKSTIDLPNQIEIEFLHESQKADEKSQKRQRLVIQLLATLTVIALLAAGAFWWQTERVSSANSQLATTNDQLKTTNGQLDRKNQELDQTNVKLSDTITQLNQTVDELDAANDQLQQTIAETQRLADIALSRQLAAQASEQLANDNFLTGALLAVQSGRQQATVETLAALNKVITSPVLLSRQFRHEGAVQGAVWSYDEQRILIWSSDATAGVWDAASRQRLATFRHEGGVSGAVWGKDDRHILTWSFDNIVGVWDAIGGQRLATFRHEGAVSGAVWGKDDQQILTWSADRTAGVWDAIRGERLATLRHEGAVSGAMWSRDELRILTWSADGTVGVWDAIRGERLVILHPEEDVSGAVWSGDEKRILTWSADGMVGVWDAIRGERLATLRHEGAVWGAVWSKGGQRILTWSGDGTAGVWDATRGERLATLRHEGDVSGAVWSHDEQRILTWSFDNTVGVWDAIGGQRLTTLRHENSVWGAVWSGNDQHILTWSSDKTVGVWDAISGQRLSTLRYEGPISGAVWSGNEQRILTWSTDGTAHIWLTDVSHLSQAVCELTLYNFTETEWRAYLGTEPYQQTCPAHARLLGYAKRATVETGDLTRVEALFAQAVTVAKQEDNVTLTLDPHAEAIRYTAPVLAARANAAALACKVDEAIARYRQVRELAPHFFPGDPQVMVPVLAEQNGCSPAAVTDTAKAEPASE